MRSGHAIAAIYLLDWAAGDPEWLPHPVRLMGQSSVRGERLLRAIGQSPGYEFAAGAALTLSLTSIFSAGTAQAIERSRARSVSAGLAVELLLGWTCLASRSLIDEANSVIRALEEDDLPRATLRLARIVGRDTGALSQPEISRAVIETVAESACDGILAPLFYMAVGGVPLAMAYKTINTLDSMIGHCDHRYFYFGKFAARLDDAANYLPARLTALLIAAAAAICRGSSGRSALQTWRRDGSKHKSPNAGQPESAMAGALRVRLGGENTYAGEPLSTPFLGAEFRAPSVRHAKRAIRLITVASILGGVAAVVAASLLARPQPKPRPKLGPEERPKQ